MAQQNIKRAEAAIQRALVHWITTAYPELMIQATMNENSHKQMNMGCCVGITDLLLFRRRASLEIFFLELKTKTGSLSPSQTKWASAYRENYAASNTHYAVAYGFQEAKIKVAEWMQMV